MKSGAWPNVPNTSVNLRGGGGGRWPAWGQDRGRASGTRHVRAGAGAAGPRWEAMALQRLRRLCGSHVMAGLGVASTGNGHPHNGAGIPPRRQWQQVPDAHSGHPVASPCPPQCCQRRTPPCSIRPCQPPITAKGPICRCGATCGVSPCKQDGEDGPRGPCTAVRRYGSTPRAGMAQHVKQRWRPPGSRLCASGLARLPDAWTPPGRVHAAQPSHT